MSAAKESGSLQEGSMATAPPRPSTTASASNTLTVVLLASSDAQEERAREIRAALERSLVDSSRVTVQLRSGQMPIHRLIPTVHHSNSNNVPKLLFVVVGSETASSLELRSKSVHAVLTTCKDDTVALAALSIAKICALHTCNDGTNEVLFQPRIPAALQASQQAALVHDAALKTAAYQTTIASCFDAQQQITGDLVNVPTATRQRGKVRDRWESESSHAESNASTVLALVTTDRQSGFDRQLAVVPFKGAVLNLCSRFWFDAVADIVPNHLIAVPHPSVSIVKKCTPFPIEFVVRYVHT